MNPADGSKCEIVVQEDPVCNPAKSGAQSSPVQSTDTLCSKGTSSGFVATGTNPINYSWTCNLANKSVNCSASYTPQVPTACSPGSVS